MASVAARSAPVAVFFDGQSLNNIPTANTYPRQMMTAHFPGVPWKNLAITGLAWTDLSVGGDKLQRAVYRVDPYANAADITVLIMCGGTTDVALENESGADVWAEEIAYRNARRAAGFDRILNTTLVRSQTLMSAGDNTERVALNVLKMADGGANFDGMADLAANATLADYTNAAVYPDGIHWAETAAGVAGDVVAPVLAPFLV